LINSFVIINGNISNSTNITFTGDQFQFDIGVIDPNGRFFLRDLFLFIQNGTNRSVQTNCHRDGNYTDNITVQVPINATTNQTVNVTIEAGGSINIAGRMTFTRFFIFQTYPFATTVSTLFRNGECH